MKTRIKYFETKEYFRTEWFPIRANFIIRALINKLDNTLLIQEFDRTIIHIQNYKDIRSAKRLARKLLVSNGLQLSSEVRRTNP